MIVTVTNLGQQMTLQDISPTHSSPLLAMCSFD